MMSIINIGRRIHNVLNNGFLLIFRDPTPDDSLGVRWSPYTTSKEQYMDIGNELMLSSSPDKEQVEFWQKQFEEYCPHYTFSK